MQSERLRNQNQIKQFSEGMPLITIITVVYNGEKTLERTIKSVINQTYPNIEYIIIDGASTDGTVDIIKKHENHIDYWCSEPDKGIYDAMNKGIEKSSGELIGIINSDDWYEPDAINAIADRYIEKKEIGIYHGQMKRINAGKGLLLKDKNPRLLVRGMIIHHPACFVHRLVYEKIGYFNTNYKIAADYDFLLRAYLNSIPFVFLTVILANMSFGGFSSINYIAGWKEEKTILVAHGFSPLYAWFFFFYKVLKRMASHILTGMKIYRPR
jgi:glycosyltransferase involved in cell wall biosynthesis